MLIHSLTHVIDVLPEGLAPALRVSRCMRGQRVGYVLSLTLCADVYTLGMDRISLWHTDKSILTEEHTHIILFISNYSDNQVVVLLEYTWQSTKGVFS